MSGVIATVNLLFRVTDEKFVFVIFISGSLSENADAQGNCEAECLYKFTHKKL